MTQASNETRSFIDHRLTAGQERTVSDLTCESAASISNFVGCQDISRELALPLPALGRNADTQRAIAARVDDALYDMCDGKDRASGQADEKYDLSIWQFGAKDETFYFVRYDERGNQQHTPNAYLFVTREKPADYARLKTATDSPEQQALRIPKQGRFAAFGRGLGKMIVGEVGAAESRDRQRNV